MDIIVIEHLYKEGKKLQQFGHGRD